jgi:hypothetical protein
MSICADFVVADAVRETGLPGAISLSTGKKQGNFIKFGSYRVSLTIICAQFHNVTSKFPVNWNRE